MKRRALSGAVADLVSLTADIESVESLFTNRP